MARLLAWAVFLVSECLVVAYLLGTLDALPAVAGTHFNASGAADGFMTSAQYRSFMLVFAVGIPVLVVVTILVLLQTMQHRINIPYKQHWLAPERREATVAFLQAHSIWLGTIMALFTGYLHALLLEANAVQPPRLPEESLYTSMGVLLAVVILWGLLLPWRFRRPQGG